MVSRTSAAREAGISERQQKTALRVAAIPEDEFKEIMDAEQKILVENRLLPKMLPLRQVADFSFAKFTQKLSQYFVIVRENWLRR